MKKILVAVASLALASGAGCGGGGAEELLGKMRGFKDKMCKCTTKECAEGVQKDMMEWGLKNMDKIEKQMKSATKAQQEAGEKLDDEMDKCREKAMGSGDAPTPPAP